MQEEKTNRTAATWVTWCPIQSTVTSMLAIGFNSFEFVCSLRPQDYRMTALHIVSVAHRAIRPMLLPSAGHSREWPCTPPPEKEGILRPFLVEPEKKTHEKKSGRRRRRYISRAWKSTRD